MIKMIQIFLLFFCIASVQAQQLQQNMKITNVEFRVKNFGISVTGNFSEVVITSIFNKNDLQSSFVLGILQVKSIDTHNKKRDKHLLESDYFDVAQFSEIRLQSTKIEHIAKNEYVMKADLSIKGITKSMDIPIEIIEKDKELLMKSEFEIDRSDFNVGDSSWILSDKVKINVVYTANK